MPEPFDPEDPADIVSDRFRKEVCEIASKMLNNLDYRRLTPGQQLESFMAGTLVGVVGVCFAHIESGGRDAMMEAIAEYLPQAREQAEAIIKNAARQHP